MLIFGVMGCGSPELTVHAFPARQEGGLPTRKVVFIAGPDSHGPWAHEHKAGNALLAGALRQRNPHIETVNVYGGWPPEATILASAHAVVFYCDGGENHLLINHLDSFDDLVAAGLGVVALHYAVEVPKGGAAAQSMLRAIGGYFETDWSVNPHWQAKFTALPQHPITVGIGAFEMDDEWYFNMRFQSDMVGVTPILEAIPPQNTLQRSDGPHSGNAAVRKMVAEQRPQVVAWAYQRHDADGQPAGRGFGYTGGHYHANWQDENARELVLNAIAWVAE